MKNFWQDIKRPFYLLAPMYDVTDEAFRQMFLRYGRPAVFFTEFVSADGLLSAGGRPKLLRELYFEPNEHPIVAQIFGADPAKILAAAELVRSLGFDGLDINMGCPDRAVVKQGAGGALINKPELARAILKAAKDGAGEMPVSIKTRIGFAKPEEYKIWLSEILAERPAMLAVHLRTVKEMSEVPAHWDLAQEISDLAKRCEVSLVLNGDVATFAEAEEKARQFRLDGVMIGRGAFGDPAFFTGRKLVPEKRLTALRDHIELFARLYLPGQTNQDLFGGHTKNFAVMKKHFKAYVSGWPKATALRRALMAEGTDPAKALDILKNEIARAHIEP